MRSRVLNDGTIEVADENGTMLFHGNGNLFAFVQDKIYYYDNDEPCRQFDQTHGKYYFKYDCEEKRACDLDRSVYIVSHSE